MGKNTGFIEWKRLDAPKRPTESRLDDFDEIYEGRSSDERKQQGGRCMDCGIPFCTQGCPLGNMIPDWNDLIFRDQWKAAIDRLHSTNNFPEFTGRLCPAPCEPSCVLAINDSPVTIEQNELEIIERAFAEGWVTARAPRERSGSRVAVVGSGPAGLAAADQLNKAGHQVDVFEKSDGVGGLLRYGIPDFKLDKRVIDRRVFLLQAEGIRFVTGVDVGSDVTWTQLHEKYDALLIAIGAQRPRDLDVPGRELDGVHLAMDFLTQQNRRAAGLPVDAEPILATGRRVVILGGGDTGADCLGTTLRQGAAEVTQLELLPVPAGQRLSGNPWPQWPMTLRTSSSHDEGGLRDWSVLTKRLEGQGRVERLHAVRVVFEPPANGGPPQMVEQPDSELVIETDMVILAMGFLSPLAQTLQDELGVALDARGNIAVNQQFRTSVEGVFAAGDASRGASLVVWAISDGREAARSVDQMLRGERAWLPSRGDDKHFGGR